MPATTPTMTLDQAHDLGLRLAAGDATPRDAAAAPGVYASSIRQLGGSVFLMARIDGSKRVVEAASGDPAGGLAGAEARAEGRGVAVVADKTPANAAALRRLFPWTAPSPVAARGITVGCGDRLGIATPGHIRAFRPFDATPMLAQQSVRENNFTGRNYRGVLDDATWGVFQEGFDRGWGADGDHLKSGEQIEEVLALGYTFLTLDLTESINDDAAGMDDAALRRAYDEVPGDTRRRLANRYGGKSLSAKGPDGREHAFAATDEQIARIAVVYHRAIDRAVRVFKDHLDGRGMQLEVSIDEVATPTDPVAHFVFASELLEAGVEVASIAPRFCGEFQKGIDYIGDVDAFRREFAVHAAIAAKFGYKASVHSGSDKFAVFPIVGELTGGRFHLKTAGTSWLQAMRAVADGAPSLYRDIHRWVLANHAEALRFYHIRGVAANVPDIAALSDEQLPGLFDIDDWRQVLHISYGLVLQSEGTGFRDALYSFWASEEALHDASVEGHLRRHLESLGAPSA